MSKFPNLNENITSVLIVEDESVLAIGMEYSLEEFGYEVTGIETTAKGAIAHTLENEPDIILMDINLKGKESGIEAAKHIWNCYRTPVVFLTSYSDDKTFKEAMKSEPYAYLIKPCRDNELKVAIETALHKHKYFYKNMKALETTNNINSRLNLSSGFSYDKGKNILFSKEDIINLTGNEIKLFEILSDHAGEPISFERICDYIWRDDYNGVGKLRTLIYRIKNKIGENLIENIFELGYKLKLDDKK